MRELIEEIILNSEESSLTFIADADVIGEVALNLLEDGVPFVNVGVQEIEELMESNFILAIAKYIYRSGIVDYFIEPVLSKNGDTLKSDCNIVFIDSDLIDCIDRSKFSGDVFTVKLTKEEADDEDYEKEIDECSHDCANCKFHESEEDIEDVLTEELMSSLAEAEDAEDFADMIKSKIKEAIEVGRMNAIYEFQEKLDDMV